MDSPPPQNGFERRSSTGSDDIMVLSILLQELFENSERRILTVSVGTYMYVGL